VIGVDGAIDIHCHAHEGQQDALGVAKLASKSGMMGILYKTIVGRKDPAAAVNAVRSALESWCAEKGLTSVHVGRQLGHTGFSLKDRGGVGEVCWASTGRRRRLGALLANTLLDLERKPCVTELPAQTCTEVKPFSAHQDSSALRTR